MPLPPMSGSERCNQCGGPLAPAGDALVDVLRCTGCGREIPAAAMPRLCACGCGASLAGRASNVRYESGACRSRAWRARHGYRLVARKTCQTRSARRKPDLRISYRRAVEAVAAMPEIVHLDPRAREARVREALRECLPPRLKDAA